MMWQPVVIGAVLSCITSLPALAQYRVVFGRVVDAGSGKPIPAGDVTVGGSGQHGRTRPDGVFVLHVRATSITLVVRADGYYAREVEVPRSMPAIEVSLRPRDTEPASMSGEELIRVPASGV